MASRLSEPMFVIGLTGGIGTGKSLVSETLKRLGAAVIDVDAVGHEVYRKGTEGHRAIVGAFGPKVVDPDGEIDRATLGELVFGSPEALARLNSLVHPRMRESVLRRLGILEEAGTGVTVVEAAILLEAGWDDMVDEVWVVTAPPDAVRGRLLERFGGDEEAIAARVRSQMPQEDRRRAADAIIDNGGSVEDLRSRVERVFSTRIKAAREHTNHK